MWQGIDLLAHAAPMERTGFRVVEDQQFAATRLLVDSHAEHDALEAMVEASKPPRPSDCVVEDYLLYTPFRYPPLWEGTRFGKTTERSLFYGSLELKAAFAEVAHRRMRFVDDTDATIPPISVNYTSFCFAAEAESGLDLTQPPFAAHTALLQAEDYTHTQALGSAMRAEEVEMFLFASVRLDAATNLAAFTPCVFTKNSTHHKHWVCITDAGGVSFLLDKKTEYFFEAA